MSSEQTEKSNQGNNQIPNDWMPTSLARKRKSSEPMNEEMEAEFQKMLSEGIDGISPKRNVSDENKNTITSEDAVRQKERNNTLDSVQTEPSESIGDTRFLQPKRVSGKQRKESLEEYRQMFLTVPKLEDRKPVFISREVRDRIDEIVHRLGGRGRSVSGFIENLARHHLEIYQDDIDGWKKL